MDYAELQVTTNYSFLRGGSHPQELVERAIELGHTAIGIADRNTLAGVVRAWAALKDPRLKDKKPKLMIGARLVFADGVKTKRDVNLLGLLEVEPEGDAAELRKLRHGSERGAEIFDGTFLGIAKIKKENAVVRQPCVSQFDAHSCRVCLEQFDEKERCPR